MNAVSRWPLTKEIQETLMSALTDNLPLLRAKLDISQEELSNLIGLSRQTYSSIESKKRPMTWQTYLSLVFFFDSNEQNHNLLRHLGCFPEVLVHKSLDGAVEEKNQKKLDASADIINMLSKLDDQALQSLQTVAMVEYARCTKMPGEDVVKAFNGSEFKRSIAVQNEDVGNAINRIKKARQKHES